MTSAHPIARSARATGPAAVVATAVIVHWGPVEPTVALARRLASRPEIHDVVVVANDRRPAPGPLPAKVRWTLPPRNLGFAGAFEHAADLVPDGTVLILANNDLRIGDEVFEECYRLLREPRVGIAAPALFNEHGLQSGAGTVSWSRRVGRIHHPATGAVDAAWVTGALMFIRADCHRQVRFDPSYFLGSEDVDFCLRARRAHWRTMVSFTTPAYHRGGSTIPAHGYLYYLVRNRIWLARRSFSGPHVVLAVARSAIGQCGRTLAVDVVHRRSLLRTRLAVHGLVDGLRAMPAAKQPFADEPRAGRWTAWH